MVNDCSLSQRAQPAIGKQDLSATMAGAEVKILIDPYTSDRRGSKRSLDTDDVVVRAFKRIRETEEVQQVSAARFKGYMEAADHRLGILTTSHES